MSVLEFENTQGIMLTYSTASVLHRLASYFIDMVILGVTLAFLSIFIAASQTFGFAIMALVFIFYTLLMEIFNDGRSLGKMALGLKVVRIDGRPVTGYDCLMRWMFRWVDIYMSLGSMAAVLVSATPRSQRIGDLLADTTVIHTKNLRIPLKRLMDLNRLSSYKPVYNGAAQLSEEQVLLAKETMQRSLKYKNQSHKEALHTVADRIADILGAPRPENAQQFLQTVIKDYIALTR
ncbi:MAG: hypothetical protein GC178_05315 [Flavobacteriales bacterium]|nr:hypothetical protein [Flavobacteriales bacterium]